MTMTATKSPMHKQRAPKKTAAVDDWSWRITWRGRTWTDAEMTAQHVAVLMILNGRDDWMDLNVDAALADARSEVLDGPMRLINTIAAFVIVDRSPEGTPDDEAAEIATKAIQEIRAALMVEVIDAIKLNV